MKKSLIPFLLGMLLSLNTVHCMNLNELFSHLPPEEWVTPEENRHSPDMQAHLV